MKKQITLLKTMLLAVLLLVGSGSAWGTTETLTCTAGAIVSNTMTFNTANFTIVHAKAADSNFASYTPWRVYTNNTVTITGGSSVNTITSVVIYTTSPTYASAVNGTISVTGGGTASASVSGNNCTITITGTATAIVIDPTAQTRWSSIDINYTPASSCTTPTYSFASSTVNKLTTDAAFTNAFTSDNTSTKVWSSTNEAVATVDSNGEVTIVGAGSTNIRVNQEADATYCAVVDASYALTVTAPGVAEPTNQPTELSATTNSTSQITVTWTDATGAQLPEHYLVKASTGTITAPVDGTAEADAALVQNIAQGKQTAVFTGLDASTTYNFSIWPYTNSGAAIDYKTDGIVATASATTETPLGIPVATAATDVTPTGFTANWGAAAAATGYELDVFQGGDLLSEDFASISSGNNTSTTGSNSAWTGGNTNFPTVTAAYQAGGAVKIGTSSAIGSITTKELDLTSGATLTFDVKGWTTVEGSIAVTVNGANAQTVTYTATMSDAFETKTLSIAPNTSASTITIATSAKRAFIDNVVVAIKTSVSGSPFTVTETSKAVSGLNPDTEYFYTVVAKNATGSSVASNEISVTTPKITFTGTGDWSETARWNTASVPGTTDNVIIDGDATVSSNIEVAGLTVNASKSLTVNAGKQLTVSAALTNNGTLNLWSTEAGGTATLTAGSTSGTGIAHVSQYLKDARNWYVASPVSGADLPATGYTLYERDEANASWPTPTGTFTQGRGYIAFPDAAASTLTFSGTLNLANVDVALTWSGASSKGFNLIGNPYPSHLTWTKAFTDANVALIEPSIYYRTNGGTANNSGLWSTPTYNAFSGASVGGATAIIPPMQAVWVRAIAAGTLTLDNSKLTRSHQGSNPLKAPAVVESQKLRLVVTDGQASDEILLYFNANASNAYDRYDSPKMINGANSSIPDIFTMADNEQLVINGMSTIPTEIPLYFKANASTASQFSVSATEFSNFEVGTKVYIKNKNTSIEQLISDGTAYSFNASANPSFSIIIKAPGVISGFDNNSSINFHVFANAIGQITIASPIATGNDVVSVYNAVGQRVLSQNLTSTRTVLNKTFTSGVYVVEVNGVSHKVIVK